ncbi:MAG: hypothetical protein QE493_03205 [Verrucomicrobiae bacterium]|nr:hypothetical protein [Verrucomicrobiae bacterium]
MDTASASNCSLGSSDSYSPESKYVSALTSLAPARLALSGLSRAVPQRPPRHDQYENPG